MAKVATPNSSFSLHLARPFFFFSFFAVFFFQANQLNFAFDGSCQSVDSRHGFKPDDPDVRAGGLVSAGRSHGGVYHQLHLPDAEHALALRVYRYIMEKHGEEEK